jgi:hypothetical protein
MRPRAAEAAAGVLAAAVVRLAQLRRGHPCDAGGPTRGAGPRDREGRGTDRPGRATEGSRSMMVSSPVAVTAEGEMER